MKLVKFGALTAVGLVAGLSAAYTGCSSPAVPNEGGTEGGTYMSAKPPAAPTGPTTTSSDEFTYALDALLLGDSKRGETAVSPTAWKDYGFDIDGKLSDSKST